MTLSLRELFPGVRKESYGLLEYPQLGNPLTVMIQSLLQGLSVAFSTSLEEVNVSPIDDVPVVVTQPQKYADAAGRACIQEGRVNPGH